MGEFFAEYGFTIGGISAVFIGFITAGISKFIKNKLAGSVVGNFLVGFKKDVGEENFNEMKTILQDYGVKKIKELAIKLFEDNQELKNELGELKDLFRGMLQNQVALGVYDDNPQLKQEIIDKL